MPAFKYTGRNQNGEQTSGVINAKSVDGVAEKLMKEHIIPIKIEKHKVKSSTSIFKKNLFGDKLKLEDLIIFCRQMNTMIRVGIPVIDSLSYIGNSTQCGIFAKILPQIAEAISSGQTFTDALKQHPKHFPEVIVNIIAAGENSGQLERSFKQLAEYLEFENKSIKRIKSATRYPIIILAAAVIALGIINFMVIPSFAQMFSTFKTELPLPTRIMIGMSNFFVDNAIVIAIAFVGAIFGFKYAIKQPAGKYHWHHFLLKMPIFGPILKNAILGRFSRMFAMMLETGIPLIEAINLVGKTIGNSYVTTHMSSMGNNIEHGDTVTNAAKETKLFSPMIIQMMSIGEETGSMDSLLHEVATFYENEVDYDLNRLGDMLEPVLLVIMGVMVLFLALGVFLPMWDMASFAQQK